MPRIPDDVAESLRLLDSTVTPPDPRDKTPAIPIIRNTTGVPDDVRRSLALLDNQELPDEPDEPTGPSTRAVEADVLSLALRKGIDSNTALAAHRKDVAAKMGIAPGLVTPQTEETAFYRDHDPEELVKKFPAVAKYLGVEGNAELVGKNVGHLKTLETFFRRAVQDPEIVAAKGVMGAVESAVGVANLFSKGKAGKFVEDSGLDLEKAQRVLGDLYTPEMQAALKNIHTAEGFLGTLKAAAQNPSAVGAFVGESLPSIYLGSLFGRGLVAAGATKSAATAAAAGEGITMAGGSAEQIRQQTEGGELSWGQTGLAVGVGVAGGLISAAGAKFAQKLGIEDIDVALVTGKLATKLDDAGVPKALATQLIGGFVSEGAVEELPQSVIEQIASNIALERPWDEGVPEAAALGLVTGGVMGSAMQTTTRARTPVEQRLNEATRARATEMSRAVQAGDQRDAISAFAEQVASTQLKKESPAAFKEFIKTMAEDPSAIKEVFIDAKHLEESLQQSGIKLEQFAKDMPGVAQDLEVALATNGEVRIPIEDYATHIMGTKVEPMLLDQLRTTAEGMTYREAEQFFQEEKQSFAEQAAKIATESTPVLSRQEFEAINEGQDYTQYLRDHENKVEAFAKDAQEVNDKILTGMNNAKRFNRFVNEVYAVPFREFYAVNAAREGVLPSELYARLPLNFSKMQIEEGGLEQAPPTPSIQNVATSVATDDSFTKENVVNLPKVKDWTILTAENPEGVTADAATNATANDALKAELDQLGLKYETVFGLYPGDVVEAESYIIYNITQKQAHELGNKYKQQSVLTREGLVYNDGKVTPPISSLVFDTVDQASATSYTRVPRTGAIFTFDLDWSKEKALKQGEMSLTGVHFSKARRAQLEGTRHGEGIPAAERARVQESDDPRIKTRVDFYVDLGDGVFPETGLGAVRHDVELKNIYDASTNPLRFSYPGNRLGGNVFEAQLLDAGYDGYFTVQEVKGKKQGRVVVLGEVAKSIPVGDQNDARRGGEDGLLSQQTRADKVVREADGSLQGLPRKIGEFTASHWQKAEEVTRDYMAKAGLKYNPPSQYVTVNEERATRIAKAFDEMAHDPQNPLVKQAYEALVSETTEQYRAVIESGLVVEFIDFNKTGDPYEGNPRAMTDDVRNNNHMWVFSTREGFGSDADFNPQDNPLLNETEFEISGQKALVNDLFRVVHDYFGHVKEGVGFRAAGEENAWRAHMSMFSPLAGRALTTETRGQNSWVNFGPFAEANKTASAADTHYADQKIGLLPEWASTEGATDTSGFIPETINVDGVERTTLNSKGRLIYPTEEGIRNFWKWFGDSKVVDEQGRPTVVYHGTRKSFDTFEVGAEGKNSGTFGVWFTRRAGVFFAEDAAEASEFATQGDEMEGALIVPVNLSIQNPADLRYGFEYDPEVYDALVKGGVSERMMVNTYPADMDFIFDEDQGGFELVAALKAAGYDGARIVENNPDTGKPLEVWIAFDPNQIKSAIGNNGDFSNDPNILKQSAFYSALERALPGLDKLANKQGEVKTAQVKSWINSRIKDGEFKKEEVEAVGLTDWLDLLGESVTVTDVTNFVRQNGVTVEDILLGGTVGGNPIAVQEYEDQPEIYTLYRADDPEGRHYGSLGEIILQEDGQYEINVPDYTGKIHYDTLQEALERVGRGSSQFSSTKFDTWVLPGGENYRELLLTLPDTREQQRQAMNDSYRELSDSVKERLKGHAGFNLYDARDQGKLTREEATRLSAIDAEGNRIKELPKAFSSYHFDQKNILAHVRLNERTISTPPTSEQLQEKADYDAEIARLNAEAKPYLEEKKLSAKLYEEGIRKFTAGIREATAEDIKSGKITQAQESKEIIRRFDEKPHELEAIAKRNEVASAKVAELSKQVPGKPDWMIYGTTPQKVLFIEEIQSDWGQEGREKGFASLTPQEQKELRALDGKAKELGDKVYTVSVSKRTTIEAELLTVNKRRAELREKVRGSTPSGPFVQNTKSWTALAVKRILRYAAENGFDKVAWTTGAQQAARYDLSRQVDRVIAKRSDDGTYYVHAIDDKERSVIASFYTAEELPGVIGKDLAAKIITEADAKAREPLLDKLPSGYSVTLDTYTEPSRPYTVTLDEQTHGIPFAGRHETEAVAVQEALDKLNAQRNLDVTLSGVDLQVGGEGMKVFYDKLVPSVFNDISKKLNGGKVGSISLGAEVNTPKQNDFIAWAKAALPGVPENTLNRMWARGRKDEDVARFLGEVGEVAQPSLDITPELREKIMQGLPLFQGQRAGFNPNSLTISLLEGSDLSSVIHEGGHFYLEALNEMASRPEAPQQIKDDFRKTLEWFGVTGNELGVPGGELLDQKAFHGSPHDHNKFDSSKIGTGEGAQAYGYGHYFAESKDVAEWYKDTLTEDRGDQVEIDSEIVGGDDARFAPAVALYNNRSTGESYPSYFSEEDIAIYDDLRERDVEINVTQGRLYEVELAPEQDEYLLWDRPLSEQSDKVKAALIELDADVYSPDGDDYDANEHGSMAYSRLASRFSSPEPKPSWTSVSIDIDDRAWSGKKKASEYLHSLGIRGIKYLDGSSRGKGEGNFNYVVFSDEDIEIIDKYFQGGETPQPGQLPPGRTPEEIWNSMTLEQKRPYHEQWAQSWERYALEGKAPTLEMQPVFARFRAWMLSVYKSLKKFLEQNPLAGKLNDDVRAIFDRLIASEEAIATAERARSYAPLFSSAEEAGVTVKQYGEYLDEAKRAAEDSIDELNVRSIKDMKWLSGARSKALKALQNEARGQRKQLRAEVEQEIAQEPIERAKLYLKKGQHISDTGEVLEADVKVKLNRAEVAALRPDADPARLRGMLADDGIELDLAAQILGFSSGEALVDGLVNSEPTRDKIAGRVDQRMLEEHGDLVDERALGEAADEAVHNEARARFMATGLKMLLKTSATAPMIVKAARQAAEAEIARKKVREIRPGQYAAAETRANKEALKRAPRDRTGAAEAQRAALLNNKLYAAARDAKNEAESILRYVKKFDNNKLGKVLDADYLEQIRDLLQPFEFKNVPLRQLDKRQSLLDWVAEQEANGFQPAIDVSTVEELKHKNYKDMTLDELRGLKDTIKQIEHLGRYKHKLLTAKDKREFNERVLEADDSIRENANRTVKERGTPTDTVGRVGQWFRQMSASHRKFSSLMREMDGGKDNGVMWNLLSRGMNEAGDTETAMRQQAAGKIAELFKMIKLDQGFGNLRAKKRLVPGTDISMTHEQRIMFGMNWGNLGNRQRLLDGGMTGRRAISEPVARQILGTLTKADWDFIQANWDYIATYKDQIAALERKMTGVEPTWIDAAEVDTKFGTYRGGYFPAKYDAELSTRSESLEAVTDLRMGMKGAFGAAATRNGYTQERSKQVIGRPLLLSFNVIPQHINEVIHRLSWQPWITDATRILRAIDAPVREHYGPEILRELRDTVNDIATGDAPAKNATEAAINRLRIGSTIVGMGWRVTTALLQPSGLAQSYVRVGPKWVSKGLLQFLGSPNDSADFVDSKSSLMTNRATTMNREINEVLNTLRSGETVSSVTSSYFWLIAKMQRAVDIPTWLGAYEKGLAEVGYENAIDDTQRGEMEAHAVSLADQAVLDSQSGGMTKDLARVQRGSPLHKILTNFYSYFSATYNLNIETVRKTNFLKPTEVMLMANNLIVLNVLPVLFSVALKEATKGECGGDDIECLTEKLAQEQVSYLLGQMILLREVGAAIGVATGGTQYGYQGPAGLRFFGDLYKAGVQINQGEPDMPMFKSMNSVAGAVLHYPAGQINNTIEGIIAVENGDVEGVSILPALLFGPPRD